MELNIFDGSQVNLIIALGAGFITFFASCLLPLVPTYLAYLSGVSLNDHQTGEKKWRVFKTGALFVVGFIITFILLGLTINKFAGVVAPYRQVVEKAAGLLFISLGLFMLGIFKNRLFSQERRLDFHGKFQQHQSLHALITGIAFGFGWSPCIGPVLAVILFWAAQAESATKGAALLTAYGIGLGIPFLIIALGFEKVIPWLKKHARISQVATYLSGIIVILTGILLLLGRFEEISLFLIQLVNIDALSV